MPSRRPPWASSTASTIESRLGSQPTTARRGVPSEVGATSAWISTSTGRVPSMPAKTAVPAVARSRPARNSSEGFGTSRRPPIRHLEHADLVGGAEAVLHRPQDAEMVAGIALEGHDRVDHVLDHPRAGDLPVLGDVADEDHGRAGGLGEANQRLGAAADLGDGPGRRFHRLRPHGLDRIDDGERGRPPCDSVATMSSTLVSAASSTEASAKPEALGAQPHLRHRLFARDVGDAVPAVGERRRGLHQQRRLADARIAAEQDHRAAHEAAAGDAVEFGDARSACAAPPCVSPARPSSGNILPFARRGSRRDGARPAGSRRRSPRRSCSSRRRLRTCLSSGCRRRRSSGRRSSGDAWPSGVSVRDRCGA